MTNVTSKLENDILTIYIEGVIDTNNADTVEASIKEGMSANPSKSVVLDFDKLDYISSAGLRVILRLRKSLSDLKIINANPEVYTIFVNTGFSEMLKIEKAYRRYSVDGCEIIGNGAKGTVYRLDTETIIKVYKNADSLPMIHKERELARRAFILGIPTAISYDVVKVGDSYGSVFELLDAKSYTQLIRENPDNFDEYIKSFAELLKNIHTTIVSKGDMPDIKPFIIGWLNEIKGHITDEQYNKLYDMIDNVPDTLNMLHCDYHTNNVMMQNGETLLIDMDTLSHGNPIFELANIYITYVGFGEADKSMVENFLNLPYETAVLFWKKFLPIYLGSNNEDYIKTTEDKIKLLSYIRMMRHYARRGNTDHPSYALCKERIPQLLETVTNFNI